jgi:cellobiose-specific phosphotransferase system component IIB
MSEELDQMNAQAMRALRKLLDYINNIGDELEETQDLSTLQKQLKFVQLAPQIKMALSELRETIKDYYNHQDKVIKEKESQSMTLQEMINNLSTYMVPVLKEWEKQKKIEILDRNLIKNI